MKETFEEKIARLRALADSLPETPSPVGSISTRPERLEIILYEVGPGRWEQAREEGGKIVSISTGRPVAAKRCKVK